MIKHISKENDSVCLVFKRKEFIRLIQDIETAVYHAKIGGQGIDDENYSKNTWKIWASMTETAMDFEDEENKK
jgi:hypothetical protein